MIKDIGPFDFGVGILLALYLVDKIIVWINKSKGNGAVQAKLCPRDKEMLDEVKDTVGDIYKMHDVRDESGIPVWYCHNMKELLEKQSSILEDVNKNIEKALIIIEQHTRHK